MRLLPLFAAGLLCGAVQAADISVLGVFPGKALLVVDGASPRIYSVGASVAGGTTLVEVSSTGATLLVNGRRETLAIGQYAAPARAAGDAPSVTLAADANGHYLANGKVNGVSTRMMIDTGATMIAMSAADAQRFGVDYLRGRPSVSTTANGKARVYVVRLDRVSIGDIELYQFDAVVHEGGLPFILLGNNFLNRFEMRRNGEQMTLTKRY